MTTTGPRTGSTPLVARGRFDLARVGRYESTVGFLVGVALLSCGALALLAALVGLGDGGDDSAVLAALAAAYLMAGYLLGRQCRPPLRLRSSTAFLGVLTTWLTFVATSTIVYEVLGSFEHVDDSLFESVAGFTTTAASVVGNPERLSNAVLTWRAGTQWLGGLAGLLFVVAVLPSIGVGGLDVTRAGQRYSGTSLRSHRTVSQLRRLTALYLLLTASGIVLFLLGGMNPFDAFTYAATTISTGGFANHSGSFGHFDSVLVEWAGVGGMILGGANLAMIFRAVRNLDPLRLLSSFEFRAYLAVVFGGGLLVTVLTNDGNVLSHEAIRQSLFHVASAASTTGHFVGSGWGVWDTGPQLLLLAIMGVGAMSGSAGGGFRMLRALSLLGYLRRELVLQVHPRAVASVKVGRQPVSDELVNRMIGYQAQYLLVAGAGAVAIAVLGGELVTSITAAISSLANVGPALGDLVPGAGGVLQLPRPARASMLPLMLLGRLEIAPVLVGAAVFGSTVRSRAVAVAERSRRDDGDVGRDLR